MLNNHVKLKNVSKFESSVTKFPYFSHISKYNTVFLHSSLVSIENSSVCSHSTITSPMEEGTPTAPLMNLSNSTSNILGKIIFSHLTLSCSTSGAGSRIQSTSMPLISIFCVSFRYIQSLNTIGLKVIQAANS